MLFTFSAPVAVTAVLSTLALANPAPQSPAEVQSFTSFSPTRTDHTSPVSQDINQTTQLEAAIASYALTLETDPALLSLVSLFETNPGALSTFQVLDSPIRSMALHGETPTAGFLDVAPTEAQSFFGSVLSAEASIASMDGFTRKLTQALSTGPAAAAAATQTSGNAAAAMAMPVGLSAAALGGFVGVVMAL